MRWMTWREVTARPCPIFSAPLAAPSYEGTATNVERSASSPWTLPPPPPPRLSPLNAATALSAIKPAPSPEMLIDVPGVDVDTTRTDGATPPFAATTRFSKLAHDKDVRVVERLVAPVRRRL